MTQKKEKYLSPMIEVIKLENGGVIAASGNLGGVGNGGSAFSSRSSYRSGTRGRSASTSDLEDLINDILTIDK